MRRTKKWRLLRQAFRVAGADKILGGYSVIFLISALLIRWLDPAIATLGDSLWYCFAVATTVGLPNLWKNAKSDMPFDVFWDTKKLGHCRLLVKS